MIYAFDTYYYEDYANTVCIAFEKWDSEKEEKFLPNRFPLPQNMRAEPFIKENCPAF
ncbi:hypothetical protein [Chryseobacterium sp. Bi04]|uniref:hypothetical protein n=1 Tax=Chryseobacterium sp. Bi04 TaxID=2822345 RepID=UPI001D986AC7|nr:hypothetical protein SRABI04_02224 [Chryseobacterium sp. Bi04]